MVAYSRFVNALTADNFIAQADAIAFRDAAASTSRKITGYDLQRAINVLEANVTLGAGLSESQKTANVNNINALITAAVTAGRGIIHPDVIIPINAPIAWTGFLPFYRGVHRMKSGYEVQGVFTNVQTSPNRDGMMRFTSSDKTVMEGLYFDGDQENIPVAQINTACILAQASSDVIIRDFYNKSSIGPSVHYDNCPNIRVYDFYLEDVGTHGVEYRNTNNQRHYIYDFYIKGRGDLGTTSSLDGTRSGGGLGIIGTISTGSTMDLSDVSNGFIEDASDTGIKTEGANATSIRNIFLKNYGKDGVKIMPLNGSTTETKNNIISNIQQTQASFRNWRGDGSAMVVAHSWNGGTISNLQHLGNFDTAPVQTPAGLYYDLALLINVFPSGAINPKFVSVNNISSRGSRSAISVTNGENITINGIAASCLGDNVATLAAVRFLAKNSTVSGFTIEGNAETERGFDITGTGTFDCENNIFTGGSITGITSRAFAFNSDTLNCSFANINMPDASTNVFVPQGTGHRFSNLRYNGALVPAVLLSDTPLTIADSFKVIRVNATSGAVTITLPAAAEGLYYRVLKTDSTANTVAISRAGSDLINGVTSVTLSRSFDAYDLWGTNNSSWVAGFVPRPNFISPFQLDRITGSVPNGSTGISLALTNQGQSGVALLLITSETDAPKGVYALADSTNGNAGTVATVTSSAGTGTFAGVNWTVTWPASDNVKITHNHTAPINATIGALGCVQGYT